MKERIRYGQMEPSEFISILNTLGLTAQEAADLFGLGRSTVYHYAQGKGRPIPPSHAIMLRLVVGMKLTPDTIRARLDPWRLKP